MPEARESAPSAKRSAPRAAAGADRIEQVNHLLLPTAPPSESGWDPDRGSWRGCRGPASPRPRRRSRCRRRARSRSPASGSPGMPGFRWRACRPGSPAAARAWSEIRPWPGRSRRRRCPRPSSAGQAPGCSCGIVQRFGNHHLGQRLGGAVLGQLRAGEAAVHAQRAGVRTAPARRSARTGRPSLVARRRSRSRRCIRAPGWRCPGSELPCTPDRPPGSRTRSLRCPTPDGGCSHAPARRKCGPLRRRRAPPARGTGR